MTFTRPRHAFLLLAVLFAGGCVPDAGRPDFRTRAFLEIAEAEDRRRVAGSDLELLLVGASSNDARLRAAAVRALGRLENPGLAGHIVPVLADPDAEARAEAANGLAQAVHRGSGALALDPLLERAEVEDTPGVLGVIARSLGRLTLPEADRARVRRALVSLSRDPDDPAADAPRPQLIGVALGMESFVRGAGRGPVGAGLISRARELTRHGIATRPQTLTMVRIRELALMTLAAAEEISVFEIEVALRDPGEEVRRVAAAALGQVPAGPRAELIRRSLRDPSPQVRLEAVHVLDRDTPTEVDCTRLLAAATRDETVRVRLAALDALDRPCPQAGRQLTVLRETAASLGPDGPWHPAAHALAALATLAPARAAALLPRFTTHESPFVRSWATRAAARLEDRAALRELTADPSPNVRTEALSALAGLEGRAADGLLIAALRNADDPRLILTTARLLQGTPLGPDAADAALSTLDRLSEMGHQTLRDPRVALLELAGTVGDSALVGRVEPYLRDADPRVAETASTVLTRWTDKRWIDAPRPAARLPLPGPADVQRMTEATVVLEMEGGGRVEIALRPWLAPTNAFRFMSMAQAGTLRGLTFHRVVPNFVVQGGSPGANEYAGHGSFTRDEVGLAVHWRGTVGVSTRGRDTGDGQIFVNLVDNVRLDHDYTIFGEVTAGMDVVDSILEGNVIRRAEVRIP